MTTTDSTTAPLGGIAPDDPLRVAEGLRDEFRAGAAERDRERKFPYEQCAAFRDSGLLGLMVPREHGGYGGTFTELMKVVIAISAGDSNIGQMYQLHTGGIRLMQEFASPAVQAKWLPRFTRELWIANAYSEVGTKSVNDFNTTVTPDGDGWRLNGRKFYCTGSLAGDITFGPCRIAGTDEVRVFFTPTSAEGVTIHDDWSGFGQRTTASGTTEFRDVWIPDELCLGSPDPRSTSSPCTPGTTCSTTGSPRSTPTTRWLAMSDVGLMFVGAVLFVNGLLLLGKIDGKGAAVFNLFVGALQVAIPFYLIATAPTTSDILLDSGIFLFGFTYLYVGISNLAGHEPAASAGTRPGWRSWPLPSASPTSSSSTTRRSACCGCSGRCCGGCSGWCSGWARPGSPR